MANRIGTLTTPLYLVFFIAAVLMVSGSTAWSQEAKWTVASASKARILVPGGTWQPLTVETALAPGAEIKVGPGGRAVIEQNGDIVTLSPNSHMKVPAPKTAGGTSILQKLGTMLFKVRKRDPRLLNLVGTAAAKETPFKVETPYLAAVIKGTIFSVNVSPQGSALHVTEGLVEAISVSTGERGLVRPGQTARISSVPGGRLTISHGGKTTGGRKGNSGKKGDDDGTGNDQGTQGNQGQGQGQDKANKGQSQGNAQGQRQAKAVGKAKGLKAAVGGGAFNIAQASKGLLRAAGAAAAKGPKLKASAKGNVPGKGKGKTKVKTPGQLSAGLGGGSIPGVSNAGGNGRGNAGGNGNGNGGGNGNGNGGGNNGNNGCNGKGKKPGC